MALLEPLRKAGVPPAVIPSEVDRKAVLLRSRLLRSALEHYFTAMAVEGFSSSVLLTDIHANFAALHRDMGNLDAAAEYARIAMESGDTNGLAPNKALGQGKPEERVSRWGWRLRCTRSSVAAWAKRMH